MIHSQDRSGWIGASDTHFVMGKLADFHMGELVV